MAGLTDNNMKSGIRTGADENNPSLFFIAAGLVFYRVKWYNKNVCGAKTAAGDDPEAYRSGVPVLFDS